MSSYQTGRTVEFQHCDPAGIVFYPRYFEMINSVIEEWFDRAVGTSFAAMHVRLRKGVPTARLAAEFLAPSRLGERLDFHLDVERLGRSGLDLVLRALCGGQPRLRFSSTIVWIDLATGMPEPWPDDLRSKLAPTHLENP